MLTTGITEEPVRNVQSVGELAVLFGWQDYLVFGLMLALSAAIGIYYGFFAKKTGDTEEFLMAGRSMTTFPIAMSLIARSVETPFVDVFNTFSILN